MVLTEQAKRKVGRALAKGGSSLPTERALAELEKEIFDITHSEKLVLAAVQAIDGQFAEMELLGTGKEEWAGNPSERAGQ